MVGFFIVKNERVILRLEAIYFELRKIFIMFIALTIFMFADWSQGTVCYAFIVNVN
jgi:hypothetical protein